MMFTLTVNGLSIDAVEIEDVGEPDYQWTKDALCLLADGRMVWVTDQGCSDSSPYDGWETIEAVISGTGTWQMAQKKGMDHDLLKAASKLLELDQEGRIEKFNELTGEPPQLPPQAVYYDGSDTVHIGDRTYVRANRDILKELEDWANEGAQFLLKARDRARADYAHYVQWQSRINDWKTRNPLATTPA